LNLRVRLIHSFYEETGETGMMGRHTSDQGKLFYAFDLDMIVPTDHLLRGIDAVLDLSEGADQGRLGGLCYGVKLLEMEQAGS
jgi:hypothetical protein